MDGGLGRDLVGRPGRRALSAPSQDATEIRDALGAGAIRRVLVIRAARVGDTLHVRPALELLRQALPDAELVFLASDYALPAARGL